ncbi:MAG: OmpA family protein, partial [Bacteroidia bacterium]|nr:OmpA family protein [Bacteroidia bacterium]
YFDTGSSVIRPESAPELERLIKFLNENPKVKIRINGHTDNTGNPATKLELSLDRANAVRDYLIAHKISPHRITTKGFGMQLPVADNETEEGRALNRRVEFQIMSVN